MILVDDEMEFLITKFAKTWANTILFADKKSIGIPVDDKSNVATVVTLTNERPVTALLPDIPSLFQRTTAVASWVQNRRAVTTTAPMATPPSPSPLTITTTMTKSTDKPSVPTIQAPTVIPSTFEEIIFAPTTSIVWEKEDERGEKKEDVQKNSSGLKSKSKKKKMKKKKTKKVATVKLVDKHMLADELEYETETSPPAMHTYTDKDGCIRTTMCEKIIFKTNTSSEIINVDTGAAGGGKTRKRKPVEKRIFVMNDGQREGPPPTAYQLFSIKFADQIAGSGFKPQDVWRQNKMDKTEYYEECVAEHEVLQKQYKEAQKHGKPISDDKNNDKKSDNRVIVVGDEQEEDDDDDDDDDRNDDLEWPMVDGRPATECVTLGGLPVLPLAKFSAGSEACANAICILCVNARRIAGELLFDVTSWKLPWQLAPNIPIKMVGTCQTAVKTKSAPKSKNKKKQRTRSEKKTDAKEKTSKSVKTRDDTDDSTQVICFTCYLGVSKKAESVTERVREALDVTKRRYARDLAAMRTSVSCVSGSSVAEDTVVIPFTFPSSSHDPHGPQDSISQQLISSPSSSSSSSSSTAAAAVAVTMTTGAVRSLVSPTMPSPPSPPPSLRPIPTGTTSSPPLGHASCVVDIPQTPLTEEEKKVMETALSEIATEFAQGNITAAQAKRKRKKILRPIATTHDIKMIENTVEAVLQQINVAHALGKLTDTEAKRNRKGIFKQVSKLKLTSVKTMTSACLSTMGHEDTKDTKADVLRDTAAVTPLTLSVPLSSSSSSSSSTTSTTAIVKASASLIGDIEPVQTATTPSSLGGDVVSTLSVGVDLDQSAISSRETGEMPVVFVLTPAAIDKKKDKAKETRETLRPTSVKFKRADHELIETGASDDVIDIYDNHSSDHKESARNMAYDEDAYQYALQTTIEHSRLSMAAAAVTVATTTDTRQVLSSPHIRSSKTVGAPAAIPTAVPVITPKRSIDTTDDDRKLEIGNHGMTRDDVEEWKVASSRRTRKQQQYQHHQHHHQQKQRHGHVPESRFNSVSRSSVVIARAPPSSRTHASLPMPSHPRPRQPLLQSRKLSAGTHRPSWVPPPPLPAPTTATAMTTTTTAAVAVTTPTVLPQGKIEMITSISERTNNTAVTGVGTVSPLHPPSGVVGTHMPSLITTAPPSPPAPLPPRATSTGVGVRPTTMNKFSPPLLVTSPLLPPPSSTTPSTIPSSRQAATSPVMQSPQAIIHIPTIPAIRPPLPVVQMATPSPKSVPPLVGFPAPSPMMTIPSPLVNTTIPLYQRAPAQTSRSRPPFASPQRPTAATAIAVVSSTHLVSVQSFPPSLIPVSPFDDQRPEGIPFVPEPHLLQNTPTMDSADPKCSTGSTTAISSIPSPPPAPISASPVCHFYPIVFPLPFLFFLV